MGFDFDGTVNELKMFTENDGDIYRQQTTSILKNLATKKARGVYDSELAVQAFMYLAETGAKKYAQEFGGPGASWHEIFPTDVRRAAAKGWRDEFETEYNLGNYDQLLPMKYQGNKETVAKTSKTSKKGKTKKGKLPIDYLIQAEREIVPIVEQGGFAALARGLKNKIKRLRTNEELGTHKAVSSTKDLFWHLEEYLLPALRSSRNGGQTADRVLAADKAMAPERWR